MAYQSNADIIKNISNMWSQYRSHCLDTDVNGKIIKIKKKDHAFYDLFTDQWNKKIEEKVSKNKFTVKSSLGEGGLSAIPWLAIMNKSVTEKISTGF